MLRITAFAAEEVISIILFLIILFIDSFISMKKWQISTLYKRYKSPIQTQAAGDKPKINLSKC